MSTGATQALRRAPPRSPDTAPVATGACTDTRERIVVVASLTSALVNFRFELLRGMSERGYEVIALAPDEDALTEETLAGIGVRFVRIPMTRTGLGPLADLRTLYCLWREFRRLRPDVVLPFTMKPIIYGGIAARLAGVRRRFALVTGLGYVFVERKPAWFASALRAFCAGLYRLALRGAERVFVYNEDDRAALQALGVDGARLMLVPGSGVDTERFAWSPPSVVPLQFLMVARLLRDKGVIEYAEAARIVRARHPNVRCTLLGPFDSNPSAISATELAPWTEGGTLEYLGHTRDVRPYLTDCSVFVLPSYREGISRTILEAMATGRPIVTTDAPGCADPVEDGVTGFVVPVRDAQALSDAMERFVAEPALVERMGRASRTRVESLFDVHRINAILFEAMDLADGALPAAATGGVAA